MHAQENEKDFERRLSIMLKGVHNNWDNKLERSHISSPTNVQRANNPSVYSKQASPMSGNKQRVSNPSVFSRTKSPMNNDMHNIFDVVESEGVEIWGSGDYGEE